MKNVYAERESERRLATVMFADISGFTAMSEKMDPEEVTDLMNNCFSMMEQIIEKYDGIIDKFIGDCVMVLFGVPAAIENAPQKAINTAIEIRNGLIRFNNETNPPIPLDIHIGINTGPVVAGNIGGIKKRDFTVIGDTVNIASRLEETSQKGQVLVGYDTYIATRDKFEYRELKPASMNGKEEAVSVFELLSEKEDLYTRQIDADRRISSNVVGRTKEINILKSHIDNLVAGKGSIVNIIGEAGIGKSRLAGELKNFRQIKEITLLKGRSISMGKNLSFHPLIDLLQNWAKIEEEDNDETSVLKLESAIRLIDPGSVDEVLPFIITLMGLTLPSHYAKRIKGIEGEALEKLIMMNIRSLLVKGTLRMPVVIWMEDLHWADTSSIELLETFFRLVETRRICFINVFRPGFQETCDRIVETIREKYPDYYTEIPLQPLNENQSILLINNLLNTRGFPYAIRDQILKRTGGNPFFIEEVLRSLIDEGAVELKNGKFEVTGKINSVIIPQTINEVLMARIDRLEENTRNLVKVASVIGRSFFYRIIAEVMKTADIDNRIDYLKKIQLILERKRLDEMEYFFKHALAQEAAYASILLQKKKELHLKIADTIETVFKERLNEFYGMLAYHYSSGENLDKAEEYMLKAGEDALKSAALSEALHYYKEALAIYMKKCGDLADTDKIAMMEKNIALALFNKGQHAEAVPYFDRAMAHYGVTEPVNSILRKTKFIFCLADFIISLYLPFLKWKKTPSLKDNEIVNLTHKKLQALSIIDPVRMFIETVYLLKILSRFNIEKMENGAGIVSGASYSFSWPGISFVLSRKISGFVKNKVDKNDVKALLYYELSDMFPKFYTGNWKKACDDPLIDQSIRIGEIHLASIYISFNARIKIEQGNHHEARRLINKLHETGELYEHDFPRVLAYILNTKLLIKIREIEKATAEADAGIEFISRTDFKPILFVQYSLKARVHVLSGNILAAEKAIRHAAGIKSEINVVPLYLSYFYVSRFMLHLSCLENALRSGNDIEVAEMVKTALSSGKKMIKLCRKVASDRTEAYALYGTFFWISGKEQKAKKWWGKSVAEGENLGLRIELAHAYKEIGTRLTGSESIHSELRNISGKAYIKKAASLYTEMKLGNCIEALKDIS